MRPFWSIFRTVAAWLLIATLAGVAGWRQVQQQQRALAQQLLDRAAHCAVAFIAEDVRALRGTPGDLDSVNYRSVKDRLQRLHVVTDTVRSVFLLRSTFEPGWVIYLADSAHAGTGFRPGDEYPGAATAPGLQAILRDQRPQIGDILLTTLPSRITAFAPVGDTVAGAPRHLVGLEVDVSHWRLAMVQAGLTGFAFVLLLLGVPFGIWSFLSRERDFNREIRRLSAAIQQSHSMVVITDVNRIVEYANDGCTAATGYHINELLGQPLRQLLPVDVDEVQRAELHERLLNGERWQGELSIRCRNGDMFPARAVFSPVRNRSGRIANFVGVIDNISEQKAAENAIRDARDQAESADRAKGEFLAVMSHELRTPLNGIIGFAALLQDTALTSEQSDYTETIRKSGGALLALTNELLDYSRIDAGRMRLDPQACSPRQIVEEAVELLSARAAEKNLELLVTVSSAVPEHVLADPGRLRQVLVNLVGNAIKFTPAGEVEVDVTATPREGATSNGDPRVRLEVTVRDTGVGIPLEKQDRLFTPFSQIDASTTRKYGGAGLGLAITRSLVRLMEGDIEVMSASGTGSVFRFHILADQLEANCPLAPLPAKRVAVISSNRRARTLYAGLLEGWGLVVTPYANLAQLPVQREHDVLLIDVLVRDAALWPSLLREHPGCAAVPAVGLAAVSIPPLLRDELRRSFRALLKKPLRDSLFHAVLQKLLRD
ncbi:MAG: ATP-binding protein [Candidatus Didemnitutus sp.]|nr:ATP-binding protein [Candidatus Didemnitutus sp.]